LDRVPPKRAESARAQSALEARGPTEALRAYIVAG